MSGLTLDQVKGWLRYDTDDNDVALTIMLKAGVQWIERYTGHLFTQRAVTESLRASQSYFDLRWKPFQAGSLSVSFIDCAFAEQEFDSASIFPIGDTYRVQAASWPRGAQTINLTYMAGYATSDEIPDVFAMALALWSGMTDADRASLSEDGKSAMHFLLEDYHLPVLA
ncbi:gp6-like head-tail connector protein [Novosphingobium sp. PhB165]|uniref:head-tail connector protein n=1 Tax=Novosphingobium sp. PhB165 TaxID=2485105 RepID=UPI0010492660|nr:head-tail connector protein [Novosphingobium sp. PhB165]TCM17212.1 gp6-like head-tail connector protein [Novosphingobium sp. PhB165]